MSEYKIGQKCWMLDSCLHSGHLVKVDDCNGFNIFHAHCGQDAIGNDNIISHGQFSTFFTWEEAQEACLENVDYWQRKADEIANQQLEPQPTESHHD